jgi:hypothetical protein
VPSEKPEFVETFHCEIEWGFKMHPARLCRMQGIALHDPGLRRITLALELSARYLVSHCQMRLTRQPSLPRDYAGPPRW